VRWRKRGMIFDLRNLEAWPYDGGFAQSPQALVLEDRVRIYFSTRARDGERKYLSHIAYVDFDRGLKEVQAVSAETVIPLGDLGCFDEHGIFPIHPVERGETLYAFTCGWSRRVSVPVETSIGLAVSQDRGKTFKRLGRGPVLGPSLHEPFLVGDPFVRYVHGTWHMWYIYGAQWLPSAEADGAPSRVYKIGHATATSPESWEPDGRALIQNRLGPNECQALPTVFARGGRHHMIFCYREAVDFRKNRDRGYRLGYAWSDDLANWTRQDDEVGIDVSTEGWDSDMLCYPHVFECDGAVYLLYNGNAFGRDGFGLAILDA
jgi:hypothetical protein